MLFIFILVVWATLGCGDGPNAPVNYPWKSYKVTDLPKNAEVKSIFMLSPSAGWASDAENHILKYSAGRWSIYKTITNKDGYIYINAIYFSGPKDGWLVGTRQISYPINVGVIMHYDGNDWSDVTPSGMRALGDVCALAPNDVWVAAADGIYHYDGVNWAQSFAGPPVGALHFSSSNNGWAVYGYGRYLQLTAPVGPKSRLSTANCG